MTEINVESKISIRNYSVENELEICLSVTMLDESILLLKERPLSYIFLKCIDLLSIQEAEIIHERLS